MLGLFKKKEKANPGVMVVTLKAKLQPMDRGDLEDAFTDVCDSRGIAAQVVGGGTMMLPHGEVDFCDIEIELPDLSDAKVAEVLEILATMLAPKGSFAMLPDGKRIPFGHHEGLGLYLNGTELPDEVYANNDINQVIAECERLLEGVAMVNSHWRGDSETALYMYGTSYAEIERCINAFVDSSPLCQKSRRVQIA